MGSGGSEIERMNRKKSPVGWFPRGRSESYLDRKIRLLQEAQGMAASLDETLASSRHLSRIEREKQAALTAAQEATETRKIALIEASWCRILKAARIPYTSAELQKAEKKAAEAFNKAAALGVALKTNAGNPRGEAEFTPRTPSRHKITASLDTAFEVDEEVAAALKFALQHVSDVTRSADADDEEKKIEEEEEEAEHDEEQENKGLNALMLERVRNLEPEQRESLGSLVETRGLNALLREESQDQELNNSKSWKGGLGDVLVKHVSRLEAEKAQAKRGLKAEDDENPRRLPRKKTTADVPDLGSVLVKHVSRIEREKQQAKKLASSGAEQAQPGISKLNSGAPEPANAWGGLDLGSSLKRHVSKLEAEQAAWRRAAEDARNRV